MTGITAQPASSSEVSDSEPREGGGENSRCRVTSAALVRHLGIRVKIEEGSSNVNGSRFGVAVLVRTTDDAPAEEVM
jgi:hypothetical protein